MNALSLATKGIISQSKLVQISGGGGGGIIIREECKMPIITIKKLKVGNEQILNDSTFGFIKVLSVKEIN